VDVDALAGGEAHEGHLRIPEHPRERERCHHELQPPRVDPLEVEHVAHDVLHDGRARVQRLDRALRRRLADARGVVGCAQHVGDVLAREERRAQVVHHDADELGARRLRELRRGRAQLRIELVGARALPRARRVHDRAPEVPLQALRAHAVPVRARDDGGEEEEDDARAHRVGTPRGQRHQDLSHQRRREGDEHNREELQVLHRREEARDDDDRERARERGRVRSLARVRVAQDERGLVRVVHYERETRGIEHNHVHDKEREPHG